MTWVLKTAPAIEPVTTAEFKTHSRIDVSDEDTLIDGYIASARATFEDRTGRSLITQTWNLYLDQWPADGVIELPRGAPLQSVTHVKYWDTDDNESTVSSGDYRIDTNKEPGRIVLKSGSSWPADTLRNSNAIEVEYIAGYGDAADDVPQRIKDCIKFLVALWYENREPIVVGTIATDIPHTFKMLLRPFKVWWF